LMTGISKLGEAAARSTTGGRSRRPKPLGSLPAHGRTGGGGHASYGWGCASGRFICATDLSEFVSWRCLRAWETFVTKMSPIGAQRCKTLWPPPHRAVRLKACCLTYGPGDMLGVDFFAPETLLTSYRAMSAEQSRYAFGWRWTRTNRRTFPCKAHTATMACLSMVRL
jgi:hypothetical protein